MTITQPVRLASNHPHLWATSYFGVEGSPEESDSLTFCAETSQFTLALQELTLSTGKGFVWKDVWIDNLDEPGYRLLRPIPVEIRRVEYGYFLASFSDANIAISGQDSDDAFQTLKVEIIETFEVLIEEPNLGPDAKEQLRTLNIYIAKT